MKSHIKAAVAVALRLHRHVASCSACIAGKTCKDCGALLKHWQAVASVAFAANLARPPPD